LKLQYELDEKMRTENITYNYRISNIGPSTITEFLFKIQIPTSYFSDSKRQVKLLDVKNVDVKAFYGNKMLEIKWNGEEDSSLKDF
jgi:hypothetical protein